MTICVHCGTKCYNNCKVARYARQKVYSELNKDKIATRKKAYYEENKEKYAVYRKNHYETNKRSYFVRARARSQGVTVRSFAHEKERVELIYYLAKLLTDKTGEKHVVDHVIPLKHPLVSGLHVAANLRIMKSSDNDSKYNKWDGTHDNRNWKNTNG